jgi:hypothetical protein
MISTSILCRGMLRKTTSYNTHHSFATTLLSSVGSIASGSNLDRRDDYYGCSSTLLTPSSIITTPRRTILSSSSFSSLPPEEEKEEKSRVDSLTPYQKEIELRKLDQQLSKLNTLRAINTGELYTFRGKFKMLSRDYGMGFLESPRLYCFVVCYGVFNMKSRFELYLPLFDCLCRPHVLTYDILSLISSS